MREPSKGVISKIEGDDTLLEMEGWGRTYTMKVPTSLLYEGSKEGDFIWYTSKKVPASPDDYEEAIEVLSIEGSFAKGSIVSCKTLESAGMTPNSLFEYSTIWHLSSFSETPVIGNVYYSRLESSIWPRE